MWRLAVRKEQRKDNLDVEVMHDAPYPIVTCSSMISAPRLPMKCIVWVRASVFDVLGIGRLVSRT